jgi:hypothetical protein
MCASRGRCQQHQRADRGACWLDSQPVSPQTRVGRHPHTAGAAVTWGRQPQSAGARSQPPPSAPPPAARRAGALRCSAAAPRRPGCLRRAAQRARLATPRSLLLQLALTVMQRATPRGQRQARLDCCRLPLTRRRPCCQARAAATACRRLPAQAVCCSRLRCCQLLLPGWCPARLLSASEAAA